MKLMLKLLGIGCLLSLIFLFGCEEGILEKEPLGSINEATLTTKSGVNGLLIGAYSLLDGIGAPGGDIWSSLTVVASMASDDAHVGTEPNGLLASIEGYTWDPLLTFLTISGAFYMPQYNDQTMCYDCSPKLQNFQRRRLFK